MRIIGRKRERDTLQMCLESNRPEFIAVYGRRRVGKTYLIREFFNRQFSFYSTGSRDENTAGQLKAFHASLMAYGDSEKALPTDWFEAFARLRRLLSHPDIVRDPVSGRRVIFLDELPWMDTPRSDFKSALDYFWNSWGSAQEDIMLIVCGSATAWMIQHLVKDTKGFHNRLTRRIRLMPFTLKECEELLEYNDIPMSRPQVMECYMTFGGIPYYLNLFDARLSLAQNIDELCFKAYGELHEEYQELFRSLYKSPEKHIQIIETLSQTKTGKSRKELAENPAIGGGAGLTKTLEELEECGFIRSYTNYKSAKPALWYQMIDPFILFSLRFIQSRQRASWISFINTPGYAAWRGNAFEILCLNHLLQIKTALGIPGVETQEYAWQSSESSPGAQIDLVIDRKDDVINLCEMKFTTEPFVIDADYERNLIHKRESFYAETNARKSLHLTMVSGAGVKRNAHSGCLQNVITGEDLFS